MRRRIFGLETEYGIAVGGDDGRLAPSQSAATNRLFDTGLSVTTVNQFLVNGARCYPDLGHPEYATAECDHPDDLLAQDRAGEELLVRLTHDAANTLRYEYGPQTRARLVKNNVDQAGNSYGCHENYCTPRTIPVDQVVDRIGGFLATRAIWAGAGQLIDELDGSVRFVTMQRAPFLAVLVSSGSTRNRGIVNNRDEPHANCEEYRRLHVVVGDSTMADTTTWLKIASTHLVLRVVEEGPYANRWRRLAPRDVEAALKAISSDLDGRGRYRTVTGRWVDALEVQRYYHARVGAMLVRHGGEKWEHEAYAMWGEALDALADDWRRLIGRFDWPTKLSLLEALAARYGSLEHPKVRLADLRWHDPDPEVGLARKLEATGRLVRRIDDDAIEHALEHPPATTRAALRSEIIRRAHGADRHITPQWAYVLLGVSGFRFRLDDPFRTEDPELLAELDHWIETGDIPGHEEAPKVIAARDGDLEDAIDGFTRRRAFEAGMTAAQAEAYVATLYARQARQRRDAA
jgi:proteasome accessory factor A